MYYRPDGWENPYKITMEDVDNSYPNGIPKGYHILNEAGKHDGFEEGAEDYEVALKKKPNSIRVNNYCEYYGAKPSNGTWVFIPDEVLAKTQHRRGHLLTGDRRRQEVNAQSRLHTDRTIDRR